MKLFYRIRTKNRRGFSLAEAAFSVGVLSFGFLSLIPLLGLGLNSSRQARDNRSSTQIAETLIAQAKEGLLTAGTAYYDNEGNACADSSACYRIQTTLAPAPSATGGSGLTHLTVQVTPLASPRRSQFYAVVYSPQ